MILDDFRLDGRVAVITGGGADGGGGGGVILDGAVPGMMICAAAGPARTNKVIRPASAQPAR